MELEQAQAWMQTQAWVQAQAPFAQQVHCYLEQQSEAAMTPGHWHWLEHCWL
jgi:hypothetical protein